MKERESGEFRDRSWDDDLYFIRAEYCTRGRKTSGKRDRLGSDRAKSEDWEKMVGL